MHFWRIFRWRDASGAKIRPRRVRSAADVASSGLTIRQCGGAVRADLAQPPSCSSIQNHGADYRAAGESPLSAAAAPCCQQGIVMTGSLDNRGGRAIGILHSRC
jgi:hypothetical protein